jgi:hypothetical protein
LHSTEVSHIGFQAGPFQPLIPPSAAS